jgi:hypothetical protein
LFGRRKREEQQQQQDEESAREAERRALFEELAKRPETVCPFLGLASDRAGFRPEPNGEHRCYAFGDPAPLSDEQQRHVCLERGYSNCPRYLRGVLVIPTEELEALRRPQPAAPPPPPPPVAAVSSGGGRRWLFILPLLLVLIAAVGVGGWYVVNNGGIAVLPSGTGSPGSSADGSASTLPSPVGSASPLVTPTPLPTATAGDVFLRYEVGVGPQAFTIYRIDDAGNIIETQGQTFDNFSHAVVEPVVAGNGLRHWRTLDGGLIGWSYIKDRSGPFQIRRVYRAPDGTLHATVLSQDQL